MGCGASTAAMVREKTLQTVDLASNERQLRAALPQGHLLNAVHEMTTMAQAFRAYASRRTSPFVDAQKWLDAGDESSSVRMDKMTELTQKLAGDLQQHDGDLIRKFNQTLTKLQALIKGCRDYEKQTGVVQKAKLHFEAAKKARQAAEDKILPDSPVLLQLKAAESNAQQHLHVEEERLRKMVGVEQARAAICQLMEQYHKSLVDYHSACLKLLSRETEVMVSLCENELAQVKVQQELQSPHASVAQLAEQEQKRGDAAIAGSTDAKKTVGVRPTNTSAAASSGLTVVEPSAKTGQNGGGGNGKSLSPVHGIGFKRPDVVSASQSPATTSPTTSAAVAPAAANVTASEPLPMTSEKTADAPVVVPEPHKPTEGLLEKPETPSQASKSRAGSAAQKKTLQTTDDSRPVSSKSQKSSKFAMYSKNKKATAAHSNGDGGRKWGLRTPRHSTDSSASVASSKESKHAKKAKSPLKDGSGVEDAGPGAEASVEKEAESRASSSEGGAEAGKSERASLDHPPVTITEDSGKAADAVTDSASPPEDGADNPPTTSVAGEGEAEKEKDDDLPPAGGDAPQPAEVAV